MSAPRTSRRAPAASPADVRARPFGRWPGGKDALAVQLLPLFPDPSSVTGIYRELFAGMGAMAYRYAVPAGLPIALSDTEAGLVASYLAVRDHLEELVERLRPMRVTADDYYAARTRINAPIATPMFSPPLGLVEHAALFLYLRKTCFNGLMRTSGDGIFNVSYGKWSPAALPTICDEPLLRACSAALQGASVDRLDFEASGHRAAPGDFVYMDPPYDGTFAAYQAEGFDDAALFRLVALCVELDRRGVRFGMSNADTPRVRELFGRFRIHAVTAKSSISCTTEGRADRAEVFVCNYDLEGLVT